VYVLSQDDLTVNFDYSFAQMMNMFFPCRRCLQLVIAAVLILPELAGAQYFTAGNGDLVAGFRKTPPSVGSYELVVNLGNVVTIFLSLSPGTTIPINNYNTNQLSAAFNTNYNNIQWSVFSTVSGPRTKVWDGFQQSTLWYTLPRASVNTQTAPPPRYPQATQNGVMLTQITTIDSGASSLSSGMSLGTNNNNVLVRESTSSVVNNGQDYATSVEDPDNSVIGDFGGYLLTTAENVTGASFTSPIVSDLYQLVPSDYVDTYDSSANAYYVGYFTMNVNGTMTFTRAPIVVPQPPAPQIVSISRLGTTSTVFFTTTNGTFTYTLYYTNSTGLTTSVTNWPASPTTLTGDGSTDHLSDTTTDANRFYRVGAH